MYFDIQGRFDNFCVPSCRKNIGTLPMSTGSRFEDTCQRSSRCRDLWSFACNISWMMLDDGLVSKWVALAMSWGRWSDHLSGNIAPGETPRVWGDLKSMIVSLRAKCTLWHLHFVWVGALKSSRRCWWAVEGLRRVLSSSLDLAKKKINVKATAQNRQQSKRSTVLVTSPDTKWWSLPLL